MILMGDEVRHMNLYLDYLTTLDHRYGSFEVRDWFWDRVPQSGTATHFAQGQPHRPTPPPPQRPNPLHRQWRRRAAAA